MAAVSVGEEARRQPGRDVGLRGGVRAIGQARRWNGDWGDHWGDHWDDH